MKPVGTKPTVSDNVESIVIFFHVSFRQEIILHFTWLQMQDKPFKLSSLLCMVQIQVNQIKMEKPLLIMLCELL